MDDILFKELKNFLNDKGQLKCYPSKFKHKITALFYLASKFEHGMRYSEKEVNQILINWHTFEDWCLLRRELFNKQFMGRELNCTFYWLEDQEPTFIDFGLEPLSEAK